MKPDAFTKGFAISLMCHFIMARSIGEKLEQKAESVINASKIFRYLIFY